MNRIWEMPEIQAMHRLPSRSPLLPWSDPEKAALDAAQGPELRDLTRNEYYECLDGEWKFNLLTRPEEAETARLCDWYGEHFDAASWDMIQVPGTWTRQGYDKPHYTNVQMPFEEIPPKVPDENPTGLYRLSFTVPESWKGRRTVLHIGSAESVCIVWVNGHEVGASKDTRLPCEFDVTEYVRTGEGCRNTLAIMVIRYSDASFVEDQDQWWFGGIHRSVFLYSTEKTWIEDVRAIPDWDGSETGLIPLTVKVGIDERFPGNRPCTVSWKLQPVKNTADMSDSALLEPVASGTVETVCNIRTSLNEVRTEIRVKDPAVWSSENPARYVLTVELHESGKDGRLIEAVALVTAFRSVCIDKRHLLINGKKVYIKGVNRHEHDEKRGKTLDTEQMVKDIFLLKSHNFNAVRTCHYPDDERWYELCDKYGIYLIDEANIENHYYYDGLCRSEMYSYAYMIRVQRMVRRDKNHPSIILWSLGNESGHGYNQEMMYAWCHSFDATRPVHYEGGTRAEYTQSFYSFETLLRGKKVTDIVCPMYPDIALIKEWAEKTAGMDEVRPLIMCEYSHAMGNSNGSLSDYWDVIRKHDGLQGGFIWDWIDQGLEAHDEKGTKYWKYGGDFGDTPSDKDFCLNGLLFPDQSPKPAMKECFKVFQPVEVLSFDSASDTVTFENRFDFTDSGCLSAQWKIEAEGSVLKEGAVPLPAVKAGECGSFTVPAAEALSAFSGQEEVILHIDFVYNRQAGLLEPGTAAGWSETVLREAAPAALAAEAGPSADELRSALETAVLAGPLVPSLFRCPTENDDQKTMPAWNRIGHDWVEKLMGKVVWNEADGALTADGAELGSCRMSWKRAEHADGRAVLVLEAELILSDAVAEYPKAGFTTRIPAYWKSVRWYGQGSHESYSDRCAGSPRGVHDMSLHDLEVDYIVPQENGNRHGVRWLQLSGKDGSPALRVESDAPFSFSVLHHEPADLWRCFHTNELTDTAAAGYYILNLDIAQRGIGTATCGPDTLEQYRVRPGVYKAEFRFIFG